MTTIDQVPSVHEPPPGGDQPRGTRFRIPSPRLRRRGFIGVLGGGAMTLSLTMLGWIPFARSARAEEGTEYLTCGVFDGDPICIGGHTSPIYCGEDNWFRNGCVTNDDGFTDCYEPLSICGADGPDRNAWRWDYEGITFRCADGDVEFEGAPSDELVICSARLGPAEPESDPAEPASTANSFPRASTSLTASTASATSG